MIDKLSPNNIWVNPCAQDGGDGSFDFPYAKIQTAINEARSGTTIVLLSGTYEENLTVRELCGLPQNPITITALRQNDEEIVSCAEWYFYSVKDFIIKGITFKKTAGAAISIVGESHRNSIKDCTFDACGETSECALFLGGSGGDCNVIENCKFNAPQNCENHIAVMISQSADDEQENLIACSKNASVRFCDFENCVTAIAAGSGDGVSFTPGVREICHNIFDNCQNAIKLKTGASQIYGNIFRSNETALNHVCGFENEIFENRFEDCPNAIVCGEDTTISQNLFINSKIKVKSESGEDRFCVLICENTFVSDKKEHAGVVSCCQENLPLFVNRNIFYECKTDENENFSIKDNICNFSTNIDGFMFGKIEFFDKSGGDFSTSSDYGCTSGAQKLIKIEKIPQVDILEAFQKHGANCGCGDNNCSHDINANARFAEKTLDERDLLVKSMFFEDKEIEKDDFETVSTGQQVLRPIGIDAELEDN